GFINIRLSAHTVAESLAHAVNSEWGKGTSRVEQKVVFEYSCPNPFKEMHIGHLMSTVIGEASSRIIESQGARVIRDTYGGDVGPHVAKALWALHQSGVLEPTTTQIGEAYAHGSRAYEENDQTKVEIDTLNTELYSALAKEENDRTDTERQLLELWRHGRDTSYESHQSIWKTLGTAFDYIIHESESTPIGMRVVQDALTRGVFVESEGAVIYQGEKKGLHTLVFITSRGTPTYEAKDVGLAFLKEERLAPFDYSYIMTASEQSGHFAVFLAALEDIAPEVAKKTSHIPHGFLRLTTGKMSSREGGVITARELLDDLITRAGERNPDPLIAEQVAIGALKYFILRQAPGGDIIFDPEQSLSLEGDSGPYLQYALVRAKSILAQAPHQSDVGSSSEPEILSRLITRFPEVVARAEGLRAPHSITQYLTQLASEWNSFYARERILGGEGEAEKLAIVRAFVTTMENGLTLLGIPAPEKM
ncbi:MAG: arginine--tRNA ligase, partial [Patescibacteria group bacterium]